MKIRHLYSFFADVYAFPCFHTFIFVRNYFIFALFDNAKPLLCLQQISINKHRSLATNTNKKA